MRGQRFDNFNPGLGGDAGQIEVASNPAGAAGGGGQRRTFDDGRGGKSEIRNQQQIPNRPGCKVVLQKIEIGRLVVPDFPHHRTVGAIGDGIADGCALAFQLILKFTLGASIINGFGSSFQPIQFRRGTIRAIEVFRAPGFGDIAGLLRAAFETVGQRAGHGEIHWRSTKQLLNYSPRPLVFETILMLNLE